MHPFMTAQGLRALVVLCGLVLLLVLIRWDRSTRPIDLATNGRATMKAPPPVVVPPVTPPGPRPELPPAFIEAEKSLLAIEARLAGARDELDRVNVKLEEKQRALADLAKAAAANQRPVAVLARDEDRERIEREVADLKKRMADGDAKIKAMEEHHKQPDPNNLKRAPLVDQKTRPDAQMLRNPGMPRFAPNAAAVAAAASAGAARGGGGLNLPGATAFGDIARGQAEFIRATGERNLNDSKAMINAQTAKAMMLENKLAYTETFFEMRRMNRAARAIEAGPRPTMEQLLWRARMQAPRRLSSLELDPLTGDITWPRVLTDEPYTRRCDCIEEQFQLRAKNNGKVNNAQFKIFHDGLVSLTESLQANVGEYRAADYGKAKNFLASLKYEFDLPLQ